MKKTLRINTSTGVIKAVSDVSEAILTLPEAEYTVAIEKVKKDRSAQQNKYYWSVVLFMIAEELGYYPEDVHEMMKFKFNKRVKEYQLKKPSIGVSGLEMDYVGSTADLSTVEFEEYLAKIRDWAYHFLNLPIPLPNE
jgi:hypothetical protein